MLEVWEKLEPPDEYEDERWITFSEIENVDNILELRGIYLEMEEGND